MSDCEAKLEAGVLSLTPYIFPATDDDGIPNRGVRVQQCEWFSRGMGEEDERDVQIREFDGMRTSLRPLGLLDPDGGTHNCIPC